MTVHVGSQWRLGDIKLSLWERIRGRAYVWHPPRQFCNERDCQNGTGRTSGKCDLCNERLRLWEGGHTRQYRPLWPEHLRDDAPTQTCSRCGRKTWSRELFGAEDRMAQPDGRPCGGRFTA